MESCGGSWRVVKKGHKGWSLRICRGSWRVAKGHGGSQRVVAEGGGLSWSIAEGHRGWLWRVVIKGHRGWSQRVAEGGGVDTFLRGWWRKNQGFMLISNPYSNNVIGCGGELN